MPDAAAATPSLTGAAAGGSTGWQRLRRNRTAMAAMTCLALIVLACFLAPLPMDPARRDPSPNTFFAPGAAGVVKNAAGAETTLTYSLGSDVSGRDLLVRVLEGGRVSIVVGLAAALFSLLIGTTVGLAAGYLGGAVDALLMRVVDVLYAIPRLLFILVVIATLDGPFRQALDAWRLGLNDSRRFDWPWLASVMEDATPYSRIILMILCLGCIEWLTMARIVRGQVLVLKEQPYVAAARAMGRKPWAIMRRHLLPNLWTVILTYLTLTVPIVILDESFLSFLGLGIEDPAASWGALLKEGASAINPIESRWWLLIFPAALMSLTLLALNFIGDGLRDAFDVR